MKSVVVLVFAAFLLLNSMAFGQDLQRHAPSATQAPVTMLAPGTTQAPETVHLEKRTTRLLTSSSSFVDTVYSDFLDVSDGQPNSYGGVIGNSSKAPLYLFFHRRASLPTGWTSSICFGSSCYSTEVDSQGLIFEPNELRSLTVDIIPAMSDYPDSGIIYLTLGASSGDPGDTIQVALKSVFHPGNPPIIFKFSDTKGLYSSFAGSGKHTIHKLFQNRAGKSVTYHFSMDSVMPAGWTSSLKVASKSLTGREVQYSFGPLNTGPDIQPIDISVTPASLKHKDSAVFYLSVHPDAKNPADSANYRLVSIINDFAYTLLTNNSFIGKGPHSDTGIFTNYSIDPVTYHFAAPATMPAGWTYRFSVGDSSSDGRDFTYTFAGSGDAANNHRSVVFSVTNPNVGRRDSAVFTFKVYRADDVSDSASYRSGIYIDPDFKFLGNPAAHIQGAGTRSDTFAFQSLASVPTHYHFSLQSVLPAGWMDTLCIANACTTGPEVSASLSAHGDGNDNVPVALTLNVPSLSTPDSVIYYIRVSQEEDPSDSAVVRFVTTVAPPAGVSEPQVVRAGIAVLNAWPNPLSASARLNLEIVTDRDQRAVARVYDMAGVEKAVIDLGQLTVGANQVQVANFGLSSGDYIIRIEQGEFASEPVRLNYVR